MNSNNVVRTGSYLASPTPHLRPRLKPVGFFSRLLSAWLAALMIFGQPALVMNSRAQYPAAPLPGGATFGGLGFLNYEAGRSLNYVSADGTVMAGAEDFIADSGYGSARAFVWSAASGVIPLMLPGGQWSSPRGLSADGSTVIGESEVVLNGRREWHAFIWTATGGIHDLGTLPGGRSSSAQAVSANGSTVIGQSEKSVNGNFVSHSFVWTASGGMQDLSLSSGWTRAAAVSADGSAVVGSSPVVINGAQQQHAILWTPIHGVRDMGTLPGDAYSSAEAVSANGSTVVGYSGMRAFIWTANDGMRDLGISGSWCSAHGISADGTTVVGQSSRRLNGLDQYRAFVWTAPEGSRELTLPGGNWSYAIGMSADGSIIAGNSQVSVNGRVEWHGFTWTASRGIQDLNFGDTYSGVQSISANGSVAGQARLLVDGVTQLHTFVWTANRGIHDLGTLPGDSDSWATAISANGSAVIGQSRAVMNGTYPSKSFTWTSDQGMQEFITPRVSIPPKPFQIMNGGDAAIGIAAFSFQVSSVWSQQAVVWKVGESTPTLLMPNDHRSFFTAASTNGLVAIGQEQKYIDGGYSYHNEGFVWTVARGLQKLTLPGGRESYAEGVSANGATVIGRSEVLVDENLEEHAFVWTPSGGLRDLGTLPGGRVSRAQGVSADGTVVVGWSGVIVNDVYEDHAFAWTAVNGMRDLGTLPGGRSSYAAAVSADGSTIVGQSTSDGDHTHAFLWTSAGGMQDLGTLPGGTWSHARAVSADGRSVIGQSSILDAGSFRYDAFVWTTEEGMHDLSLPDSYESYAEQLSFDGSTVIGYSISARDFQEHAFVWTLERGVEALALPGSIQTRTQGICSDGSAAVGYSGIVVDEIYNQHAFVWNRDGKTDSLTLPGDTGSRIDATPSSRSLVFGTSVGPSQTAVVWSPAKRLRTLKSFLSEEWKLEIGDWKFTSVTLISPDSMTLGGIGINPFGQTEAWIVRLAPELQNTAPIANNQALTTSEDTTSAVVLGGFDADGDVLRFSVVDGPAHGTLSGTAPNLLYTPAPDYYGPDGLTFTVSDGKATSATATINITVTDVLMSLSSISPSSATADGNGFVLTVNGSNFEPDTVVYWNGNARPTSYVSPAQVTAQILASDLAGVLDIQTVSVMAGEPTGPESAVAVFAIVPASVGEVQTSVVSAGGTATVLSPPASTNDPGVTVSLENSSGGPITVVAATYETRPTGQTLFKVDSGSFVDVQFTGADSSDKATVQFYYPALVTGGAENKVKLRYFDGANWIPVLSSGGTAPIKNTTDNLDGTMSGGRFTVVLDNTSTPKITELSGTVFGMFNSAPQIGTLSGPTAPLALGTSATISVPFAVLGDWTAAQVTFIWDDGSQTIVTPASSSLASATKTYSAPGVHTVAVRVIDEEGSSAEARFEYVVVFDPNGGFVTGGGWIQSLASAYVAEPALSGKANFGFVSKYQKGATIPTPLRDVQFPQHGLPVARCGRREGAIQRLRHHQRQRRLRLPPHGDGWPGERRRWRGQVPHQDLEQEHRRDCL